MRGNTTHRSFKSLQILLVLSAVSLLFLFLRSPPSNVYRKRRLYSTKHESVDTSTPLSIVEDIVDYSRCSLLKPLRIYVHFYDHPLAVALSGHPVITENENETCLFIAFTDGNNPSQPTTWNSLGEPGLNHVIVNVNEDVSIVPQGREMIVQASYDEGFFRPIVDFSLLSNVEDFKRDAWLKRPSIMPLKRACEEECMSSLLNSSYCLLPASRSFHFRLLQALRAGCIPVVMSTGQPMPFQDQLDWNQASFRYPHSLTAQVPELLKDIDKEDVLEMRRRGRVFLARIDDAQALSKSLVAALAERIHVSLPGHPEVRSKLIAPNGIIKSVTTNFTRIHSRMGSKKRTASRLYSRARWNSGRDLTYTPSTLHDEPQMPGQAAFYKGTKEHLHYARLGITRDEEQFTVLILTYNRDKGVKKIIERLRDCPYLNKIIIAWNNQDRQPNGTWPEIHVPVEFVLSQKNSLNSRFLPYDRIETEAVVSIDDDMDLGQPEIIFAFRMLRENRDRVVGYPARFHRSKNGRDIYGFPSQSGSCQHSMILTSFAFVHKEFLFEYSFNQHPAILEHIDKHRNCEVQSVTKVMEHFFIRL